MSDVRVREVRRITGRHPLLPGTGAAAELWGDDVSDTLTALEPRLAEAQRAVGGEGTITLRPWPGGASVAFEAPSDVLEQAVLALEWALGEEDEAALGALAAQAEAARSPALLTLLAAAEALNLPAFFDDEGLTVGLGARGRTWALDALPSPDALPGLGLGRIPFVFVTGTNGKTTSARALARIAAEAGLVAGNTSSDGVVVRGEWIERGDWTGPGAARTLLRHPELTFAVLETARGGLMRRGLALHGADGALLTNVSDDHLGDWGLFTLEDMAWAKATVVEGVRPGGAVVVNGGCPLCQAAVAARLPAGVRSLRFSARQDPSAAAWVHDGQLWLGDAPLAPLDELPITLGGLASHNVENALGAAALAAAVGLPRAAIAAGLRGLRPSVAESRGRLNLFSVGGAWAIVDFCHNPDGMRRLASVARAWPAKRRLVLLGQSGDRSQAQLTALSQEALAAAPDRVIVKELPRHLLGRAPGEMTAVFSAILRGLGLPETALGQAANEPEAVAQALAWAQPGDLLLLLIHEELDATLAALTAAGAVAIDGVPAGG
jgi:cyanophycin synthetase